MNAHNSNISHLPGVFPGSTRPTIGLGQHRPAASSATQAPRGKFVAKGHDSQLQDAQFNRLTTHVTLMSGEIAVGHIVKRDKYTITIQHTAGDDAGCDEIFYKHAIESVLIERPKTAQ